MDSKVERIVPRSVLGTKPAPRRSRGEQRRFELDEFSGAAQPPEDPPAEGEPRTVSGRDETEAGGRLDLTA